MSLTGFQYIVPGPFGLRISSQFGASGSGLRCHPTNLSACIQLSTASFRNIALTYAAHCYLRIAMDENPRPMNCGKSSARLDLARKFLGSPMSDEPYLAALTPADLPVIRMVAYRCSRCTICFCEFIGGVHMGYSLVDFLPHTIPIGPGRIPRG